MAQDGHRLAKMIEKQQPCECKSFLSKACCIIVYLRKTKLLILHQRSYFYTLKGVLFVSGGTFYSPVVYASIPKGSLFSFNYYSNALPGSTFYTSGLRSLSVYCNVPLDFANIEGQTLNINHNLYPIPHLRRNFLINRKKQSQVYFVKCVSEILVKHNHHPARKCKHIHYSVLVVNIFTLK